MTFIKGKLMTLMTMYELLFSSLSFKSTTVNTAFLMVALDVIKKP